MTSKIIPSFASGEIDPSLHSRVDINKYSTALKTCRNFNVNTQGGVSKRTGTRYIANAKYSTANKTTRTIPFNVSNTDAYNLEFGDYYIRFYKNGARLSLTTAAAWETGKTLVVGDFRLYSSSIYYCIVSHTSGTFATDLAAGKWVLQSIYEIPTVYSSADLSNIKFEQSADVLFITHPSYPTYELARLLDTSWTFSLYDYEIPPFILANQVATHTMALSATYGTNVNLTSSEIIFTSSYIGSYFKIYHDINGQSIKQDFTATGSTGSISCFGTWRFHTYFNNVSTSESDLTITIEKSIDNGSTWTTYRTFILLNSYADTYGEEEEFCLLRMNCTAWVKGMTATLITDPFSYAGIIKIHTITTNKIAIGNVIKQFASTGASYDWAESAWSPVRGYPACVTFYQDRIVFANTIKDPATLWFSKTGDYYSFDVSETIKDTDSISVMLAARKLNGINNLVALSDLIALTADNSFRISSSTGVLTPTTILASLQENVEANKLDTIIASNKIIYVSNNTIIKDIGFDYNSASYKGNDLNVLANHLFEGYTILDLDYKKDKNSTIYMVRSDGKIIVLNYMPEQEVLAFSWYETDGLFESVSVLNTSNGKEVWVSVLRDTGRFIEIFENMHTDVTEQFYLDSGIIYDGVATTTITGLSHLEGQTVYVLGDGNVIKNLNDLAKTPLIVTSGQITLPYSVEYAIVGLPYISDFETLPIDIQIQSGTITDKKKRISSVIFIFQNSRGGWIGDIEVGDVTSTTHTNTLNEVINNRPSMDLPIPLFTGKYKHTINGSWGLDKTVFYRQYDPLPVNILGVIPNFEIGG